MNNDEEFDRSKQDMKFLRSLRAELYRAAVAYKAKKDGTAGDTVFIGLKPIGYDYFFPEG